MVGNESWNAPDYNGRATIAQYIDDFFDFASAMKAVDPTIKIIANGQNGWWQPLLKSKAAPLIDVLALSTYPAFSYTKGRFTARCKCIL